MTMVKELEAVRAAKEEKDQLWLEYQSLIPTPASPRMDGMPRSGSASDANAAIVDLRTEAKNRYDAAAERWREAEKIARAQMGVLTPWLYSLSLYHYISGMTMEQTMGVMHISEATFKRYKAELKKYDTPVIPI